MIPGMGAGMNPRQMSMMMKKLGIDVEDVENVQEIVIKTADRDYVFTEASVTIMKAPGSETWQISGTPTVKQHEVRLEASAEDVAMVIEQTGCDEETARKTLDETNGDIAEAITRLL